MRWPMRPLTCSNLLALTHFLYFPSYPSAMWPHLIRQLNHRALREHRQPSAMSRRSQSSSAYLACVHATRPGGMPLAANLHRCKHASRSHLDAQRKGNVVKQWKESVLVEIKRGRCYWTMTLQFSPDFGTGTRKSRLNITPCTKGYCIYISYFKSGKATTRSQVTQLFFRGKYARVRSIFCLACNFFTISPHSRYDIARRYFSFEFTMDTLSTSVINRY